MTPSELHSLVLASGLPEGKYSKWVKLYGWDEDLVMILTAVFVEEIARHKSTARFALELQVEVFYGARIPHQYFKVHPNATEAWGANGFLAPTLIEALASAYKEVHK